MDYKSTHFLVALIFSVIMGVLVWFDVVPVVDLAHKAVGLTMFGICAIASIIGIFLKKENPNYFD